LKDTGVFRSFVPKRFGGYEIGMDLYVDLGVCVSEACASTGWITTFYMEHNWQFSSFCDEAGVPCLRGSSGHLLRSCVATKT
jgi:3-hydroxy-9,10-secoandrosta-1,3,5(10)-triene-9,17-dione monooxygenase